MPERRYTVTGMDCAHCAREVEVGVAQLDGVEAVRVDFPSSTMVLEGEVAFGDLRTRVQALGKDVLPASETIFSAPAKRGGVRGFWDFLLARRESRLALIGGTIVLITLLASQIGLIGEAVAATAYVVGLVITLYPILKSGINVLRFNHQFSINLLMSIAAFGAIAIGEYLEAATVIFLFAIGEALEGYTAERTRDGIRALIALRPRVATRLRGEAEEVVPVEALAVGDTVLVKPGEQIPMDGTVLSGASDVNQAPITGESMPVHRTAGDTVYAGTVNGMGTLIIETTRAAVDTTLSRIITLVEQSQSARAPSQRLIDRFAHFYTPAVVALAVVVAFAPPLLFGAPLHSTESETGWLYRALVMLVIACPCALVISTPVTVISAIAAAARRGVLIKGGAPLEALGSIRAVAFDKTGTLTMGQPVVTGWRAFACEAEGKRCAACDDVLALAAAVERRAAHPLAQAVVSAADMRALGSSYASAEQVELLAGQGVRGLVDAHQVTVGSHNLFDAEFPHQPEVCRLVEQAEAGGSTTMLIADADRVVGFITLADTPRAGSESVIADLHALGLTTVMLTGDNATVGQAVANRVGVADVRAGLLPEQKVEAVHELTARYGPVAMVGDGINDTPALAAAAVGVAMGGAGSQQALEAAEIALLADDLTQLPFAVRLARFVRRLIVQNVILSFGVKAVFLLLALFGLTSLWLAIFADVGMSLLVTLNGMRPLRFERR